MAVTVTKTEGVTMLTVTSDPKSVWPPLCQVLKALLYNPLCCGVSQFLKTRSLYLLGALQVMVGAVSIALSVILSLTPGGTWWEMDYSGFPFWCGGSLIAFGIFGFISERFSSPCLVLFNIILQLTGAAFGIASVVLFSINITQINLWDFCRPEYDYNYRYRYGNDYDEGRRVLTTTLSPQARDMKEKCLEGKRMMLMLMCAINGVLIVLSVLQLCISISSAAVAIKAMKNRKKQQNKSAEDPEQYKPLLEEVHTETA
ncbi:transmembrane protein 176B-like [Gouania willdenowi]|nr:transmembrane protein 176B-like [Gouania willdenowi]